MLSTPVTHPNRLQIRQIDRLSTNHGQTPTGLDATLAQNADGTYKLTFFRSGKEYQFRDPVGGDDGRLLSIKDRNGNEIRPSYGAVLMSKLTDTKGRATELGIGSYPGGGAALTKMTDPIGRTYQYSYDAAENLVVFSDPLGQQTKFAYDANHNLIAITDPRGFATGLTYDSANRVTSITRASGAKTAYAYESGATKSTNANAHTTTYYYDSEDRVTKVLDAKGNSQSKTYTANSQIQDYTSAGARQTKATYSTDGRNNLTELTQPNTPAYKFAYGDTAQPYLPTETTDPQGSIATKSYDAKGNLIKVADKDGSPARSFSYNADGSLASLTDPKSNKTTYAYNAVGDLTTIDHIDPLGSETFGFDGASRRVRKTDGKGQATTFTLDALDRITKVAYADTTSVSYAYDANGNRTQRVDASGTYTYAYDQDNRLLEEDLPPSMGADPLLSDDDPDNSYEYDSVGNLTKLTHAFGDIASYTYDSVNLLASITDPAGTTRFGYNPDMERTKTVFPNGITVTNTHNDAGRITSVNATNSAGTKVVGLEYSYQKPGTTTNSELRYSMRNTVKASIEDYSYDEINRLVKSMLQDDGKTYTHAYSYDANSNPTQVAYSGPQNGSVAYTYNAADQRLEEISDDGTDVTRNSYAYDANGNMTRSASGTNFAYNAANQTASAQPPGTTPDGSPKPVQSFSYAGTGQGERLAAGDASFLHSILGISRMKDPEWATQNYTRDDRGDIVSEYQRSFLNLNTPVGWYYVKDARNSVVAVFDYDGKQVTDWQYTPYGNTTGESSRLTNWGFTSSQQLLDQDNTVEPFGAFYHMGQRYYDIDNGAGIGTWTQRDPISHPDHLVQANSYLYGQANPINKTDPGGLHIVDDLEEAADEVVANTDELIQFAGRDLNTELYCAGAIGSLAAAGGIGGGVPGAALGAASGGLLCGALATSNFLAGVDA